MSVRINSTNTTLAATRSLEQRGRNVSSAQKKLSSGNRINSAADDATSLAISSKMLAKIRGSKMAERNVTDGISILQVAEGGLSVISTNLIRLRELAIQAANDTNTNDERYMLNMEYQQLKLEINRIAQNLEFNGNKLLNGTGNRMELQVGVNNNKNLDRIIYDAGKMDATVTGLFHVRDIVKKGEAPLKRAIQSVDNDPSYNTDTDRKRAKQKTSSDHYREQMRAAYGKGTAVNILTKKNALNSLDHVDAGIGRVSSYRAEIGSLQNRLEHVMGSLTETGINAVSAKSRIHDTDIAKQSSKSTKNTIMAKYTSASLAQINNMGKTAAKLVE